MKYSLKQAINEQLCHMARGIQVNSSSHFLWGEVELPECLKNEFEEDVAKKSDE